jgi:hypothetical protein
MALSRRFAGQFAFFLFGLTVPFWSCPGQHLAAIGILKLCVALILPSLHRPLKAMWREGLWDTVKVNTHPTGHAFWFAYAALGFIALGELITIYRASGITVDAKELPLSFTLPWLALNGLGCFIFPTSGFSSVICNASYLVYLGL